MSFWMDACWFAIQVKPGLEFNIASGRTNQGYEDFVPTSRTDEDGRGLTERPLFSGYVFCRFDPAVRAADRDDSGRYSSRRIWQESRIS